MYNHDMDEVYSFIKKKKIDKRTVIYLLLACGKVNKVV